MFTKKYAILATNHNIRHDHAKNLLHEMACLNITNKEVFEQCTSIISNAEDFKKKTIDYMVSFLPEQFKEELDIINISSGFACRHYLQHKVNFPSYIKIYANNHAEITLIFDEVDKCFYHNIINDVNINQYNWLNKFFKVNEKSGRWIEYKLSKKEYEKEFFN